MSVAREQVAVVVVGHVDHGKSTLLGRLLVELGVFGTEQVAHNEREAAQFGKESFKYAWLLDSSPEARRRGLTIEANYQRFSTRRKEVLVIDAPGHRDFVRNMITGASEADAALLVIDVAEGVMPQTSEHAVLVSILGIRQIVVALNKLDRLDERNDAPAILRQRVEEVREVIDPLGFESVRILPVSAWAGTNLRSESARPPWYSGPSLEEVLDSLHGRQEPTSGPFRLPIGTVTSVRGAGTVVTGRIVSGRISVGDQVWAVPLGKGWKVASVHVDGRKRPAAFAGDHVGIALKDLGRKELERGEVLSEPSNPPPVAAKMRVRLSVLPRGTTILRGMTYHLHAHTADTPVRLEAVHQRFDPRMGSMLDEDTASVPLSRLHPGEVGVVTLVAIKPIVVEPSEHVPRLSRFALRTKSGTLAAGSVISVEAIPRQGGPGRPSI